MLGRFNTADSTRKWDALQLISRTNLHALCAIIFLHLKDHFHRGYFKSYKQECRATKHVFPPRVNLAIVLNFKASF